MVFKRPLTEGFYNTSFVFSWHHRCVAITLSAVHNGAIQFNTAVLAQY